MLAIGGLEFLIWLLLFVRGIFLGLGCLCLVFIFVCACLEVHFVVFNVHGGRACVCV